MNWEISSSQYEPFIEIQWPTKFQDMLDCLLLVESWVTIVMFILPWKKACSNMWKNKGCKKPGNDEILQDRKKHEKKIPTMAPTQWLPHAIPIPILYHCSSWTSSKDMMDPPRPGPSCGARRPTVEYTLKKRENTSNKMNIPGLTCLNWSVIAVHFTSNLSLSQWTWQPQSTTFEAWQSPITLADPPIASWKLCMVRDNN